MKAAGKLALETQTGEMSFLAIGLNKIGKFASEQQLNFVFFLLLATSTTDWLATTYKYYKSKRVFFFSMLLACKHIGD